jgi:SAM-dependent methyltransferase
MSIFKTVQNAFTLLIQGKWREFYIRVLIVLGQLDIKTITTEHLNLPPDRSHSYSDSGREDLQKVLSTLNIKRGDAIVDFGCGKGGALITMADYPFSKITGVEISENLADIAKKNLARLKIKEVEIVCCDATEFLELDEYNYIYFFNPFPCPVLSAVMENIFQSLSARKRKITIIYLNPECHETIITNGTFQKVKELDHVSHKFFVYTNI